MSPRSTKRTRRRAASQRPATGGAVRRSSSDSLRGAPPSRADDPGRRFVVAGTAPFEVQPRRIAGPAQAGRRIADELGPAHDAVDGQLEAAGRFRGVRRLRRGGGPGKMRGGDRQRQRQRGRTRRGLKCAWKSIQFGERNLPAERLHSEQHWLALVRRVRLPQVGAAAGPFSMESSACVCTNRFVAPGLPPSRPQSSRSSVSAFGQTGQSRLSDIAQIGRAQASPLQPGEIAAAAVDRRGGQAGARAEPRHPDPALRPADSGHGDRAGAIVLGAAVQHDLLRRTRTNSRSSTSSPAAQPSVTTGQFFTGVDAGRDAAVGRELHRELEQLAVHDQRSDQHVQPAARSRTCSLNFTQPLLRNSIDRSDPAAGREQQEVPRPLGHPARVASSSRRRAAVRNAYWDLSTAINNLKAQQESLALAQQSLSDNRKRVEIGTMAPIDIVQAQAEVASNEERVIVAEAAIKRAQDNLRALILDPSARRLLDHGVRAERRGAVPGAGDRHRRRRAQRARQAGRPAARRRTASSAATSTSAICSNQILPDVNAQVNYGAVGVGGVQLAGATTRSPASSPARSRRRSSAATASALGDVFRSAYPQWTFGVQIGYPLGASTAQANLARAQARVPAGADAAEEHRAADRHAGARVGPQRADQPEARPVGARVARAAGEEARSGGKEAGRRHVDQLLRLPGAARSGAGAHPGNPGDLGLQQVARRLRSRAARAGHRRRRQRHRSPGSGSDPDGQTSRDSSRQQGRIGQ